MDATTAAILVTSAALLTPFLIHRLVRNTPLNFLFQRPALFTLSAQPAPLPR
jgi:hypothetical protein